MKTIRPLSLSLCFLLLLAAPRANAQSQAAKDELAAADEALSVGSFETAREIYLKHASLLTPAQQVFLAKYYYSNQAKSAADYAEGLKWLKKAAGSGSKEAMLLLAEVYFAGLGVQKDSVQQMAWTKKAAEAGDAAAMLQTGKAYAAGWGLPKDAEQAKAWFIRAANSGLSEADFTHALLERQLQNHHQSVARLEKAAKAGFTPARFELGNMYEKGMYGVAKDLGTAIRWYLQVPNSSEFKNYYAEASKRLQPHGSKEPSNDLAAVKPWLLKLVTGAATGFGEVKDLPLNTYLTKGSDHSGAYEYEYYTSLLDLGFKNAYIRKKGFEQLQKDGSRQMAAEWQYRAAIVHSVPVETAYRVFTEWAKLVKTVFPDWKQRENSNAEGKKGELVLWKDNSDGTRTLIEVKTLGLHNQVELGIETKVFPR